MNRYLKIILFFLITFLLPVGIHFSLATAEVRETESYDVVYSYCDDIHFAALSLPALPDGELSSVQTLPVHIARIQRVLSHEYVVALRQALLSFQIQPICFLCIYVVFALLRFRIVVCRRVNTIYLPYDRYLFSLLLVSRLFFC